MISDFILTPRLKMFLPTEAMRLESTFEAKNVLKHMNGHPNLQKKKHFRGRNFHNILLFFCLHFSFFLSSQLFPAVS
jgi:hypothetical protein